jgi:hypothetical protein
LEVTENGAKSSFESFRDSLGGGSDELVVVVVSDDNLIECGFDPSKATENGA